MPDNIKVISYEDALSRARQPGGKWHALLGNGFSIGAHEQFRYGTLYEQALDAGLPEHVQILFDRYGTANFEEVLRQLDEGMWFARHYKLKATSRERVMKVDYDALKAALRKQSHRSTRRHAARSIARRWKRARTS